MPLSAIQNVYHRAFGFKETAHLKWVRVKYSSLREPTGWNEKNLLKQGHRHQILQFDGLQHRVHRVKQPFYVFNILRAHVGSNSLWVHESSRAPTNNPTAEKVLSLLLSAQ